MCLTALYHKSQGSITVFLSLIILLVLSIVLVSIENARLTSAYTRSREISYMALDSCFSAYAKEVFDDYGLMMLWKSDSEFSELYHTYVEKNCEYSEAFIVKPIDFLSLKCEDVTIAGMTMVTDNDCELIENQIYDYMKYAVAEEVLDRMIGDSQSLSQSEGVNRFNDKLENCSDALTEVESSVGEIYENIREIKTIEYNPKEVLSDMNHRLEELRAVPVDHDEYNKAVRDDLFNLFKQEYRKYNEWQKVAVSSLNNISEETNHYYEYTDMAKKEVNSVKAELENSQESFSEDIYHVMEEEIEGIRQQVLSVDHDHYKVRSNSETAMIQQEIVNNVTADMADIMEELGELDYGGNKISLYDKDGTFTERMQVCVLNAMKDAEGYDIETLGVNYEQQGSGRKKNEIVDFVKKIKKEGVINYIVTDNLSSKKLEGISELPSKISGKSGGGDGGSRRKYGQAEEIKRKALAGQYILDNFNCYIDNGSEALDYEIEYIIAGKSSDKDNIKEVIDKLIEIREGFNLIYLMKDSEKREEAYAMAAAITGFTGMPVVIRITQFLILGAWAYAESVIDVRDLLAGYKVSVLKNSDEWNLSLTGIKNMAKASGLSKANKSQEDSRTKRKGLSYEDYLRYLLFSQNRAEQIYRILDIIQSNMCLKYNDKFRVSECILKVDVDAEYKIKRLFSDIGFVRKMIYDNIRGFDFEISQVYGY